ncbi:MAG: hypothetical protein BWY14_00370 [Parcubacteria group bacterium ADurb.Bin192]|nr:MAG: hypothetical protein BWY14_00370 [Parcubacteria group bacterium ADurb.Bin192]
MPSLDIMKEKPSPRETEKKPSASPEKPRTLRTARTARPKRPTLRPQPGQDASEAEKQLSQIRAKLKGKQDILQHPDVLVDVWDALKEFHHPKRQPNEQDLNQLRHTLQKALYEYQARTEKIQTLRVPKTLRTERGREFADQREQLEKILSELMSSDNPSQAKQDSAGAFNDFVKWRERQQKQSMEKQVTDYESQATRLLEKEQELQEQIQAATGQTAMGNSAEEIKNHLKLSAWQKIKDWAGTLAGNKPVVQLIAELAKVQRERVVLDRKITDSKVNLGQDTFRVPDVPIKTEAQAMVDLAEPAETQKVEITKSGPRYPKEKADQLLADIDRMVETNIKTDEILTDIDRMVEDNQSNVKKHKEAKYPKEKADAILSDIDQMVEADLSDKEELKAGRYPAGKADELLASINQDLDARSAVQKETKTTPEAPVLRERRQMKKLRQELRLIKQARQDVIKDLAQPTETKQDAKSNEQYQKMLADHDLRIAELENKIANLSRAPEKLEELEPIEEASISSQAPPPPSAEKREEYLDLQAAISGRPRPKKTKRSALTRPRTVEDDEELYAQTKTIIESAGQLAADTAPAEQFEPPKKRSLRQPKASMVVALEDTAVSEKLPTAKAVKELPLAYNELQQLINERLGLLSKEDRLALNFDSKTYAEKAMNRDRAYAEGNDKEGEAYQISIDELNKVLNQAGVIGDKEDPSMHTGGKSKGLKALGGNFLTKNSDQYAKIIPTARKSKELKHIKHPETAEAPTLSVPWAQANLGESASNTWQRVAPIIAERNLGPTISKRLESLMQEAGATDLKGASIDYQALPELMNKVRANSAYASSPEASAYVLLKAFKPQNAQDQKIQSLIDKAIKAIDAQMLEIQPVVKNFISKSEDNKKAREQRQSLRQFDLMPSQPRKTIVQPEEALSRFKQKTKGRVIERSMAELLAGDKRRQNEALSQSEREKLISRAGAKNAKRFGMLLEDYLQALPLKDKTTALAQDRLAQEASKLGLKKDPVIARLISLYTKETPKAPKKPRTARTKRTAR